MTLERSAGNVCAANRDGRFGFYLREVSIAVGSWVNSAPVKKMVPVACLVKDGLAVHRAMYGDKTDGDHYVVTHEKSGLIVHALSGCGTSERSLDAAIALAIALLALADWTQDASLLLADREMARKVLRVADTVMIG